MRELMMTKDELAQAIAEKIEQQTWVSLEVTVETIKASVLEILDEAWS